MRFSVGHLPTLAESSIQSGKAGTPHLIATSRFSGEVMPEGANPGRPVWIHKKIGNLGREIRTLLGDSSVHRSDLGRCTLQLPVRGPGTAIADRQRKAAAPSRQTGKTPAADDGIGHSVRIAGDVLSLSE